MPEPYYTDEQVTLFLGSEVVGITLENYATREAHMHSISASYPWAASPLLGLGWALSDIAADVRRRW